MAKEHAQAFLDIPTNESVDSYGGVQQSKACFDGIGPGSPYLDRGVFYDGAFNGQHAIENGFQQYEQNCYNPYYMLPRMQELIICRCMHVYDKVGIVRNVIDLMGDFACQGITLVHPNKQIEKFYQKWFKKINGKDRCERFLNMLYRCGNIVIMRYDSKLPTASIDEWRKAYGKNADGEFQDIQTKKNVIPSRYVFYNPMAVHVLGGELGSFMGKPMYGIKVSAAFKSLADRYSQMQAQPGVNSELQPLPPELNKAIESGAQFLTVDQDRISAFHYKKDDWLVWANPMLYSVLDDLAHYEKLKRADSAALDGCISNVTLWNLGVLDKENSIFPTKQSINKLRSILAQNVGGGRMDLVWGPELTFKESASQSYKFLDPGKYTVTLNNIYSGLGIPPSLTGSSKDGGFTNNYISVKTLVERLEYGRDVLKTWLNAEIERVQKAMGFRFPAQVVFDQMVLSDEAAEKALLIQLVDRNLVSADTIRGKFDILSDIEKIRIKRDHAEQESGNAPPKAGQFNNPEKGHELNKIALQRGNVAPSEIGMNLHPKKDGEETALDQQHRQQLELADKNNQAKVAQQKFKPSLPNGRPKNSKDGKKRAKKRVLPKTKGYVNLLMWANGAQAEISSIVVPIILSTTGKKNIRALSSSEFAEMEFLKFDILTKIEAFGDVSEEVVYNILNSEFAPDNEIHDNFSLLKADFINMAGKEPSLEETKNLQSAAFAAKYQEDDEEIE